MKNESYVEIIKALEVLMKRALDLKIKKEDPYGEKKTVNISGIRIAYIKQEECQIPYLNAVLGRTEVYKYAPEMLITLFYEGEKKIVNDYFSLKNSYLSTYNGILTSGWPKLAGYISTLFDEFYDAKREDKKYYLEYQVKSPPHMSDEEFTLPEFQNIPKEFDSDFQELLKDYFLINNVVQLDASIKTSRKVWIVLDSDGTRVIQNQDIVSLCISSSIIDETKRVYSDTVCRREKTFDELRKEFPSIKLELQEFLTSIPRKQLISGAYPLIFDHSAVATLFHEAIVGHMMSGEYIVNEASTIFKGKLGKSVANIMPILKKLEIWDSPLDPFMIAHYKYDMEGVPAKDIMLIDRGIVKNFLHSRNSAARMRKEGNGHSLAEDFQEIVIVNQFASVDARLPEPRVSNLKVLSDSSITFKQLEKIFFKKYGYYIYVKSYSGEVNVATGTFELKVDSLVKIYPKGKKEYFHGGVFSTNLTDFLKAVKEVSDEYGVTTGLCGSGSGYVPIEEYTPAMSVYGVNWIPDPLPKKSKAYDISRDKYIPDDWKVNE